MKTGRIDKVLAKLGLVRKSVFADALRVLSVDINEPLKAAKTESQALAGEINTRNAEIARLQSANATDAARRNAIDSARELLA